MYFLNYVRIEKWILILLDIKTKNDNILLLICQNMRGFYNIVEHEDQ